MANKPKFDPNKPFQAASEKPSFNPNESFDVLSLETPEEAFNAKTPKSNLAVAGDVAKSVGESAVGVAVGAGEALNPLGIPRGIETIGRAIFTESGSPGERLKKASESAVLPELRIGETVAPAIRAGARGLIDLVTLNSPEFAKKFEEEKASQKDFEKNIGETSIKAGELGAGIISLGALGKSGLKALGAGKKLGSIAKSSAYQSLKPLGKAADRIVDQGRSQAIGEQLLKDDIVTWGASYKDILTRTTSKLKEYGEQIDFFAKTADKAASADSSIRGIKVPDLIDDINKNVVRPLSSDPSTTNIAKQVSDWAVNLKDITKNQDLTFTRGQELKKSLDAVKAQFGRGGDTLAKEAFQKVYRILNKKIEDGIDVALKKAAPSMTNNFKEVKEAYRNLADAKSFVSKAVARSEKNRFLSLTDYGAGASAAIAGTVGGGPAGASLAIPALIGNKLLRTRGLQVGAGASRGLGNIIESSNLNKLTGSATGTGLINLITPRGQK